MPSSLSKAAAGRSLRALSAQQLRLSLWAAVLLASLLLATLTHADITEHDGNTDVQLPEGEINVPQGATCWMPDCSAPFPEKKCTTVGYRFVECPALMDAGLAYRTERECCSLHFGEPGCGHYCYAKDASLPAPHRQCRILRGQEGCAGAAAAGDAFQSYRECCSYTFGGAGCATFSSKCYVADTNNPGRCLELDAASDCAAYKDRGEAWEDRGRCCAANRFTGAECATQATCWVADPDPARAPHRGCKNVSADDCPQRLATGRAWKSEDACCSEAFGPGKGCREFPGSCFELARDAVAPSDACRRLEGPLACARGLDARPPVAFESRDACCAAALPGVPPDPRAANLSSGCAYAPETCWSPPPRPEPPHRECMERRGEDARGCGADVTGGRGAWATEAACCAASYGEKGCRRYPPGCWTRRGGRNGGDRLCQRVESADDCAAVEGAGRRIFPSQQECCAASFGSRGCKVYPSKCFARRSGGELGPDRVCAEVAGKAACARELDGGTAASDYDSCCAGFPGGCRTYPTKCYSPEPLEKTAPDRACSVAVGPGCKWDVYHNRSYESMASCCDAHGCVTWPSKCWVKQGDGCGFLSANTTRCKTEGSQGLAFISRGACECQHFKRGCGASPAPCWAPDGSGSCAPLPSGAVAPCGTAEAAGAGGRPSWNTRDECCAMAYSFQSGGCKVGCWLNPQSVQLPPALAHLQRPKPSRPCVQVTTNAALCQRNWGAGKAFLNMSDCCDSNFPTQGCRIYSSSCWVKDGAAMQYSLDRTCKLQALGVEECTARVDKGDAWQTEEQCCKAAFGTKGCKVYPSSCWVPEQAHLDRTCKMLDDVNFCPYAIADGSASESLKECCRRHECVSWPFPCWVKRAGIGCEPQAEDEALCKEMGSKALAWKTKGQCLCNGFGVGCQVVGRLVGRIRDAAGQLVRRRLGEGDAG